MNEFYVCYMPEDMHMIQSKKNWIRWLHIEEKEFEELVNNGMLVKL